MSLPGRAGRAGAPRRRRQPAHRRGRERRARRRHAVGRRRRRDLCSCGSRAWPVARLWPRVLVGDDEPGGRMPVHRAGRPGRRAVRHLGRRSARAPPLHRGPRRRPPLVPRPGHRAAMVVRRRRGLRPVRVGRGIGGHRPGRRRAPQVVSVPVTNTGAPARRRGGAGLRGAGRRRTSIAPAGSSPAPPR